MAASLKPGDFWVPSDLPNRPALEQWCELEVLTALEHFCDDMLVYIKPGAKNRMSLRVHLFDHPLKKNIGGSNYSLESLVLKAVDDEYFEPEILAEQLEQLAEKVRKRSISNARKRAMALEKTASKDQLERLERAFEGMRRHQEVHGEWPLRLLKLTETRWIFPGPDGKSPVIDLDDEKTCARFLEVDTEVRLRLLAEIANSADFLGAKRADGESYADRVSRIASSIKMHQPL